MGTKVSKIGYTNTVYNLRYRMEQLLHEINKLAPLTRKK